MRDKQEGQSEGENLQELEGFRFEMMEPIPAGENPFVHDSFHMGERLGNNIMAMFSNHSHEEMRYLILIDQNTGKRIKIHMPK